MSRRTARKNAFIMLYQGDVIGRSLEEVLGRWRSYRGDIDPYAERLARGVEKERENLDERLGEVSVGWPVHRMSMVDRAILRVALYEMLFVADVPADVTVGEAVEMATGYSGEEAPQFVGGVLRGAKDALEEEETGRRVNHG